MSGFQEALAKAVDASLRALPGKGRVEVFARQGESRHLVRTPRGQVVHRQSFELGVACRVQREQMVGFGAASGPAARAGELAARLALASVGPGHAPLPEPSLLGAVACLPPKPCPPEALEELFARLAHEGCRTFLAVSLHRAHTLLARSEGFAVSWQNQLVLVEWEEEILPGVRGHFSRVVPGPEAVLAPSWRKLLQEPLACSGLSHKRQLTRVLLAPDVVAPLLVSLARSLPGLHVPASPAWHLVDFRVYPSSLLPMACDGEGLPAQDTPLVAQDLSATAGNPGRGGPLPRPVRLSWERPPQPAPVHLQQKSTGETLEQAMVLLDQGFAALAPVSEVTVDSQGRFRLMAVMGEVRQGRPQKWGVGVLAGTLRRLLAGLVVAPGPEEHVALGCIVTTPWLMVKHVEVS